MSTYAVGQGATAEFAVLQDFGILADSENYVCSSVATKGMLVAHSADGVCALVSGAMPTTATYLGFVGGDVVADNSTAIQFGFTYQQQGGSVGGTTVSGEVVPIWRFGRFQVTAVSGTVTPGAKIYPQDGGKVGATQIGTAPAVGIAVKGNSSVAGDPIIMEINLIGRQTL